MAVDPEYQTWVSIPLEIAYCIVGLIPEDEQDRLVVQFLHEAIRHVDPDGCGLAAEDPD